jgi:hypothetical protein
VDITAHSCFAHAQDYSWLSGQVQYSRYHQSWRLRYASVDEDDQYGGSVTLVDDGKLGELKDGAYVKVRGRMVNPEARTAAPPYEVDAVEPVPTTKD